MGSQKLGLFITFEGPEGAGKTTQIKRISEFLVNNGYGVIITREPGGTKFGEKIREFLLNKQEYSLLPETELLLMLAQRFEHYNKVIKQAKSSGNIVLCDRYYDSSLAYQGVARGLGIDLVANIHNLIFKEFLPDFTFILDINPEIGLNRIKSIKFSQLDKIESESLLFHKKVREAYLNLINKDKRYLLVDASQTEDKVFEQILNYFKIILKDYNKQETEANAK